MHLRPSSMGAAASGSREATWWDKCRAETPGCKHVIHFNNGGAALQPQCVLDAVQHYQQQEAVWGGYETQRRLSRELSLPYTALAELLNCSPNEIAIVGSATSAWAQVFHGIPFKPGDVILTSLAEYGSNYLAYLQVQKRSGVRVEVIQETPDGDINIPHLQQLLAQQPRPALVSISHVPTSSGRVYDAAAVGAAAAAAGVPFLLDACQSAGQMPLDVQQLRCDFLTGTSRKYFRGPRGIGFLSSSSSSMAGWEPAMIDIHGAHWTGKDSYTFYDGAVRYEQYEVSMAAKAGFGAAVQYCLQQDIARCWQRTQQLAEQLRQMLSQRVPGVTLQDRGAQLCGIVSFTLSSHADAGAVREWLESRQPPINVSVSGAGSSRLDFTARGLQEVLRASVTYYNSEQELEVLVQALQELVDSAQQGGKSRV
ncbi:aminotransferase class V [Scenedesmus sp. NREL 46B-D3]|nr:aminotransferase class V [Scenedesmus sp. NREL 46B-D3]